MTRVDPAIRRLRDGHHLPAIAEGLKIARQAPYAWKRVPPLRVQEVARITGIKPHLLRPDLYPPPPPRRRRNGKDVARTVKQ